MKYENLELGVKKSINYSMDKVIIDALEVNDWDLEKIDINLFFLFWLDTSKLHFNWYQRTAYEVDEELLLDLKDWFFKKINRKYHKPTPARLLNYIRYEANKMQLELEEDTLQYRGFAEKQLRKIKRIKKQATSKQLRYGKYLYQQVYGEKLEDKEYTKEEMSKIIARCLKEKQRKKLSDTE